MQADGAYLSVSAKRAIETILGGKLSPTDEEQMTDEEFAAWIRSADSSFNDADYGEAARRLARYFLLLMEDEQPADMYALWDAFKIRWPDESAQAGGMSGFMVGWAFNAARKVLSMPPAPNPALVTIHV